jgi:hypothetical protein
MMRFTQQQQQQGGVSIRDTWSDSTYSEICTLRVRDVTCGIGTGNDKGDKRSTDVAGLLYQQPVGSVATSISE